MLCGSLPIVSPDAHGPVDGNKQSVPELTNNLCVGLALKFQSGCIRCVEERGCPLRAEVRCSRCGILQELKSIKDKWLPRFASSKVDHAFNSSLAQEEFECKSILSRRSALRCC